MTTMAVQRGILSVDAIVEQGIVLADAEGMDGVSMRAIADRLGTGVMSLYRHVPNKERLIELMMDKVAERYSCPDQDGMTWRQALTALAETDWEMYLNHPWTLTASVTSRPPVGPSTLRGMEWAFTAIADLRLPAKDATSVIMAVVTHVQGVAQLAVAERRLAAESEIDAVAWWKQRIAEFSTDEHPHLEPLAQGFIEGDADQWLFFDLNLILDGVEALVRRHRRTTGRG